MSVASITAAAQCLWSGCKCWSCGIGSDLVVRQCKRELIAAWESRRKCILPIEAEMWETRSPSGFCSTTDSIRGTRKHPTLFKHLRLQHTSASTANVLLLGRDVHWDDASNQAIKRLLSLPSEEEVVAELVVASGKGHGLKMSLDEKTKWAQSCSGTWSVTSFFYTGNSYPQPQSQQHPYCDPYLEPTLSPSKFTYTPHSHTQPICVVCISPLNVVSIHRRFRFGHLTGTLKWTLLQIKYSKGMTIFGFWGCEKFMWHWSWWCQEIGKDSWWTTKSLSPTLQTPLKGC